MTDDQHSRSATGESFRWTLSSLVILLAILALVGAALGGIAATGATANDFAFVAYGLLVAGVALSVLERFARSPVLSGLSSRIAGGSNRLRRPVSFVRSRLGRRSSSHLASRLPFRSQSTVFRDRSSGWQRLQRRWSAVRTRVTDETSHEWIREAIGISIPLTFLGGIAIIGWWWQDTAVLVSMAFLAGWLLTIALLLGAWIGLSSEA